MFEIAEPRAAKIVKVNPRAEHHGPEEVPAVDVKIELTLPNTILSEFSRYLLVAMFSEDGFTPETTGDLLGDADPNGPISEFPHVRFPNLQPLRLNDEYVGYRLQVIHGIKDDPLYVDMPDCEVSGFSADCKEGGFIVLTFRVSRSGVDETTLGRLGVLTGHEVTIRLLAPVAAEDTQEGPETAPRRDDSEGDDLDDPDRERGPYDEDSADVEADAETTE